MRALAVAFLLFAAGCVEEPPKTGPTEPAHVHCTDQPFARSLLYLGPGQSLSNSTGEAGETPANQGHEAFTGDVVPWFSEPLAEGVQLQGNVTFDLHLRVQGAAPGVLLPQGATRYYIQFGSDRAFVPGAIVEPESAVVSAGGKLRVNATLPLPEGGFTLEAGDRFQLLITSLVEGGADGGIVVEHGGESPSQLAFGARCSESREWLLKRQLDSPVILYASQGGPARAPPQEGVNRVTVPFDLEVGAARLTVTIRLMGCAGNQCDIDLRLASTGGDVLYEAASPFANETMVLWPENLEAFLPPGPYEVRVDSYGGANYTGRLSIVMDEAEEHHD